MGSHSSGFFCAILLLAAASAWSQEIEIHVDARQIGRPASRYLTGACIEDVNHEVYGGIYSQMIFGESFQEPARQELAGVSGMWRSFSTGTAKIMARIETEQPFVGSQSQGLSFVEGTGEVGIENQGLNRSGMSFIAGKSYDGYIWVRSPASTQVLVNIESRDGGRRYGQAKLNVTAGPDWRRYDFTLTSSDSDPAGRFSISLTSAGSIDIGHAFLQPGAWGRFNDLPLRRDVVEGMMGQGITVLRYGGSMVNAPQYRWKKMIGPRDRRPPYKGTWYPYSSNGWGIPDFLDLCDAAGFLAIPAFNMDESPQDMADFVEYANGAADSAWGRRRAADGHPTPYHLHHIELGNEERVNDAYYAKFAAIAEAVWEKDPQMILVVGDFAYDRPVTDPDHISGAASRITSLQAHRKILDLARAHNREVWFDVHLDTQGPNPSSSTRALPTFIDAIDKLAGDAKHRVAVFELNANNHAQRRALANAAAIGMAQRDGRMPVVTSANALQVDGQNDNGWNQGLLFLNPSSVWLQPPGYVTRMIHDSYEPTTLDVKLSKPVSTLDVTAAKSDDSHTLVLRVVNLADKPISAGLHLGNFAPTTPIVRVEALAGDLDVVNTAGNPSRIIPRRFEWRHEMKGGPGASYTFPPHSFTVLRFD